MTRGRERDEADELGAMIGRMLNALVRRAAEGDEGALVALLEVEALAPVAANAGIALAREVHSLGEIAKFVGVTRSAVAQRAARPLAGACHPQCVGVKRCRA